MARKDLFLMADPRGPQSSGMGVCAYEMARHLLALLQSNGFGVTVAVRKDAPRLADEVRGGGGEVVKLLADWAAKLSLHRDGSPVPAAFGEELCS